MPFGDVPSGAWYYDDVAYVYANGLMNGTAADTFSPNASLTRGMLVTILGRYFDVDQSQYTNGTFSDVDQSQYYAAYVEWARQAGIVGGIGNNQFAPDAPITREDLAVILMRFAEYAGLQLPTIKDYAGFNDAANISSYAQAAVEALYQAGIINGKDGNIFDPQGTATRAEVAAMVHRFLEAVG